MHSAKLVQEYLAKRGVKVIDHSPNSPDLAPTDFLLFPKLKKELAGVTEEFKKEWCQPLRSTTKEKFKTAFVRWLERCKKCM